MKKKPPSAKDPKAGEPFALAASCAAPGRALLPAAPAAAGAMPDLTFSEIELERNVLGKTISSETWLDGVVVSTAEATRKRIPNVQTSQAEAVAKAAKERADAGYDAGHWYWQPVGGRAVRHAPHHPDAACAVVAASAEWGSGKRRQHRLCWHWGAACGRT